MFEAKGKLEEKHLDELSGKLAKLSDRFPLSKDFFVLLAAGETSVPEARKLRVPVVWASFPTETFLEDLKAQLVSKAPEPESEIVLPSFRSPTLG